MATPSYEWEAHPEIGAAHECEGECEFESEGFLGQLASLAARGLQSPALRQIGLTAARAALGALGAGDPEGEAEWEMGIAHEDESELNPVRRVYPDALLEHTGHLAVHAESEAEAGEAFLPLIPMLAAKLLPLAAKALPFAAKALPKIMSTVSRVAPQLMRGVSRIAGRLFRNPRTRALLRTVPSIVQRTVGTIVRQAAQGAPVTPRTAVQTLARQTAGFLANPRMCAAAVRRAVALDRQYRRVVRPAVMAGPAVAPRRGGGSCCRCRCCGR